MADPIGFITKVLPPKRREDILRRQRLIDYLHQHVENRVVTVTAPAGFGKTTLLVDYASDVEMPVCWLSLDEGDRDPRRLLTYFVAALRERFPEFGPRTARHLETIPRFEGCEGELVGTLVTEMHQGIPDYFVLVLDDYHEVMPSQPVNSIFDLLLRRLPDGCQLVFLSRLPITLPVLSRLAVSRDVATLTAKDLRLSPEESRELLSRYRGTLGNVEAKDIIDQAKGWIPGLLLAAPSSRATEGAIPEAEGNTESLFPYLDREILEKERSEIQEFLLDTSVLTELQPEICDALLGIDHSNRLLEELETRHFFLTQVENQTCYQYHPLLKQFLLRRLDSERPEQVIALTSAAARLLRKQRQFDEAWRLFVKARNYEEAAATVEEAAQLFFEGGRWSTLADMIDRLPAPVWWERPQTLLWRAWIGIQLGDTEGPLKWANRAVDLYRQDLNWAGVTRALIARSAALRIKSLIDEAVASIEEALRLIQEYDGDQGDLASARKHLGITLGQKGEFAKAVEHLEAALRCYELSEDGYNIFVTNHLLGVAYQRLGRLSRAAAHYERARENCSRLGNKGGLAEVMNNLAYLYYWLGKHDLARETVSRSLSLAQEAGSLKVQAAASMTLGDLERDSGRIEQALGLYHTALELARNLLDPYLVVQATESLGYAYLLGGETDKAEVLIDLALAQAKSRQSPYEEALFRLSRGMLLEQRGNYAQAEQELAIAIAGLESSGDRQPLAKAYFQMAACLFRQNRYAEVGSYLQNTAELARALGSAQFLVVQASRAPRLVRYAEGRNLGSGFYSELLSKIKESFSAGQALSEAETASAYPRIEAYALSEARVLLDGKEIRDLQWRSEKSKEMFFYLLSRRGKHRREEVLDALWPELPVAKARSTFHSTAYRLRRALYPDCLLHAENSYWLNPEGDYRYDVEQFRRLLEEAEALPKGSSDRARKLEEAVALYRGSFLKDFYSEWCLTLGRDLEQQYLKALALLAGYHAARGEYKEAVSLLERLLTLDPYDEEAYLHLMKAHINHGEPAMAQRCYRRYERVVRDELGSAPTLQLVSLYRKIVSDEPSKFIATS